MRKGYGSRFVCLHVCTCVCVCVCVCGWVGGSDVTELAATYLVYTLTQILVSLGFLCWSQHMHWVDFVKNALFESYGDIADHMAQSRVYFKHTLRMRSTSLSCWKAHYSTSSRSCLWYSENYSPIFVPGLLSTTVLASSPGPFTQLTSTTVANTRLSIK